MLEKEITKLKAQVNLEFDKKIINLKAKETSSKSTYDNMNNDNMVMHQVIKDFQKDLLE